MKKLLLCLIPILFIAASSTKKIQHKTIIRNGPGIFYSKIGSLEKDAEINIQEKEDGWLKIDFANKAYVSSKSIKPKSKSSDIFQKIGATTTDAKVTKHGLSAGIKGFAAKFIKNTNSLSSFFTTYQNTKIDNKLYKQMKKSQKKNKKAIKRLRKSYVLDENVRSDFSSTEIETGIAFASSIADLGLYRNNYLESYLNNFGNIITEATELYDQRFYFYIIDSKKVNAYACPGGIIFITKGLLKIIENEGELAFILAHEIAHSIKQHGLQEVAERKNQIAAESVFDELEEELENMGFEQDEKLLEVEKELEEELFNFYETVIAGRLDQYEFEADEIGLKYLIRSGFNPNHATTILQRLISKQTKSTNEHYTQDQLNERLKKLKSEIYRINFQYNDTKIKPNWYKIKSFLN